MPRPLKVFVAQLGFYDSVVAAPSQAAALRAWGTHLNLFADGMARIAEDQAAIDAALANPGVPLKRGVGTGDPFSLTPGLPRLPDLPPAKVTSKAQLAPPPATKAARPKAPPRLPPPSPDRSPLDAAQRRLEDVDRRWRDQERALRERRAELDAEERQARADHDEERRLAEADRTRERARYDSAVERHRKR